MKHVQLDILGISEAKWTKMSSFKLHVYINRWLVDSGHRDNNGTRKKHNYIFGYN